MTRKEQKEERRQKILMTALGLFVERGFHETKISDIASAVPMSMGLMFHYFESKEVLLLELVKLGLGSTESITKMPPMPPELFFEKFLESIFDFASTQPWVFNMFVLMGQVRRPGMPEDARALAMSVKTPEITAKMIKEGQASGVFREGDPLLLSTTFWAAVQGIMEEMSINRDYKAPDPKWLVSILFK